MKKINNKLVHTSYVNTVLVVPFVVLGISNVNLVIHFFCIIKHITADVFCLGGCLKQSPCTTSLGSYNFLSSEYMKCMLFFYLKKDVHSRASMVWHLSLPFMKSFNNAEAKHSYYRTHSYTCLLRIEYPDFYVLSKDMTIFRMLKVYRL